MYSGYEKYLRTIDIDDIFVNEIFHIAPSILK